MINSKLKRFGISLAKEENKFYKIILNYNNHLYIFDVEITLVRYEHIPSLSVLTYLVSIVKHGHRYFSKMAHYHYINRRDVRQKVFLFVSPLCSEKKFNIYIFHSAVMLLIVLFFRLIAAEKVFFCYKKWRRKRRNIVQVENETEISINSTGTLCTQRLSVVSMSADAQLSNYI